MLQLDNLLLLNQGEHTSMTNFMQRKEIHSL